MMLRGYNPEGSGATGLGRDSSGHKGKAGACLGVEESGSSRAGSAGDGEGSVNQPELTWGWGDYREPGKLLTNTTGTKQPSRAEG